MQRVWFELSGDTPYVPLLYPLLGAQERSQILFLNRAFAGLTEPLVERVDDPATADWLLLPHNYPQIRDNAAYLRRYAALSRETGTPILVFWHGDSDAPVNLPNATVLRTSQYASRLRPNEIMMPAYAEDVLMDRALEVRLKEGMPMVGFCGWARYKNAKNAMATTLKGWLLDARILCTRDASLGARRKGLQVRKRALVVLGESKKIQPNFLIRGSYSGHAATIKEDPEQARAAYIENMLASDFALVVRGDGNYSYRFYEALSLGRVPLFIDTDCALPLSDVIDYDRFILRVDHRDLPRLDGIVADFWNGLTDERFDAMQREARDAYERYLSVPSFLRYVMGDAISGVGS